MAKSRDYEPRLFLTDDEGNYYVQAVGMKSPVRVPDEQRAEVDSVLAGEDERAGAVALDAFELRPSVRVQLELTTLGACRGACSRDFGVLRDSSVPRLFLQDQEGNFFVQAEGMKDPVRVPNKQRTEVESIVAGEDDKAGFVTLPSIVQRVEQQLTLLGACRGTCSRDFGVLG